MFKNKQGKIRSGWKIAFMLGAAFGSLLVVTIVISLAFSAILIAIGDFDFQTLSFTDHGMQLFKHLETVLMFVQEIVMIVTPIIAWKFIMKQKLSDMGLTSLKRNSKELLIGLLFGIVSFTFVFIAIITTGNAKVDTWTPHFSISQLVYLVLFILVGFAEEILGRGYIMSVLRQTKSVPVIMIVSSILFALMHSSNPGIGIVPYVNLALVGILFAFIYLRSGNIWMCIGYHITWNYFQGFVYGFKVSGLDSEGIITTSISKNNIFNGGEFGPEGGLFVTLVILLGILFVWYYYKNHDYKFIPDEPNLISNTPMDYNSQPIEQSEENYSDFNQ